jgi:tetratricopeptide (TPR) repeat protein
MDQKSFFSLLEESILEYLIWRQNFTFDGIMRDDFDSPFFFYRQNPRKDLFFPLNEDKNSIFSKEQNTILQSVWEILKNDPLEIRNADTFCTSLIRFFIVQTTFQWKAIVTTINPEWFTPEQVVLLDKLLWIYPENLFLHQARLLYHYSQSDYPETGREFDLVFSIDPENSMYLCRYARYKAEALFTTLEDEWREKLDIAEKSILHAIQLLGNNITHVTFPYAWLGLIYAKWADYQKALSYIQKTIDINDIRWIKTFESYFWRARIYLYTWFLKEAIEEMNFIEEYFAPKQLRLQSPNKIGLFDRYDRFVFELKDATKSRSFEEVITDIYIEEMLFRRDDSEKNWGHIYGKTTVYSYRRWWKKYYWSTLPYKNSQLQNFLSKPFLFSYGNETITPEQNIFIKKYHLENFDLGLQETFEESDKALFPLLSIVFAWYKKNYIRSALDMTYADRYPILYFLAAISAEKDHTHNYYFSFSEYLDSTSEYFLLKNLQHHPLYLFSHIALSSYYLHNWNYLRAMKFFRSALYIDPNNPWVLGKMALLEQSLWRSVISKKIMKKLTHMIPDSPWVRDWYAKILLDNRDFSEVFLQGDIYDRITEGKYRTFEPYLWRAIAFYELWDIDSAKKMLTQRNHYYFWEGYAYRLKEIEGLLFEKL